MRCTRALGATWYYSCYHSQSITATATRNVRVQATAAHSCFIGHCNTSDRHLLSFRVHSVSPSTLAGMPKRRLSMRAAAPVEESSTINGEALPAARQRKQRKAASSGVAAVAAGDATAAEADRADDLPNAGSGAEPATPEKRKRKAANSAGKRSKKATAHTEPPPPRPRFVRPPRAAGPVLLTLGNPDEDANGELGRMVPGVIVKRPSAVIKTPYIADVKLPDGSVTLAHCPSLDCGGMLAPGRTVFMTATPKKSKAQSTHAVQLVMDHPSTPGDEPVIVGAHPSLAEQLTAKALERHLLPELGTGYTVTSQKTYGSCRVDYVLTHDNGDITLLEVKNAVAADYMAGHAPPANANLAFANASNLLPDEPQESVGAPQEHSSPASDKVEHGVEVQDQSTPAKAKKKPTPTAPKFEELPPYDGPYRRTALFPVGKRKGVTTGGVLSSRAIKHVAHLTDVHNTPVEVDMPVEADAPVEETAEVQSSGEGRLAAEAAATAARLGRTPTMRCAVLFIVNRSDCERFRPCHEACPLFASVLRRARERGVLVLAYEVDWQRNGTATLGRSLPVEFGADVAECDMDWLKRVLEEDASAVPDRPPPKNRAAAKERSPRKTARSGGVEVGTEGPSASASSSALVHGGETQSVTKLKRAARGRKNIPQNGAEKERTAPGSDSTSSATVPGSTAAVDAQRVGEVDGAASKAANGAPKRRTQRRRAGSAATASADAAATAVHAGVADPFEVFSTAAS
eukprot:TRINITY_DN9524_c0_g1_i1.p1 TRINITY_DN9524_c0_g1~~TRINITY_DN9524_c0_g1_i1.p1  ORF type:complete len:744 (+),score=132.40 TRINITY_DN9524_c0_g1_i1:121-2352(+)